jgi:hypothetical protein
MPRWSEKVCWLEAALQMGRYIALQMGRYIKANGYSTLVPYQSVCVSAPLSSSIVPDFT